MIKSRIVHKKAVGILTVEKAEDMEMIWGRLSTKTGGKGTKSLKLRRQAPKVIHNGFFWRKIGFVIVDNLSYRK